MVRHVDQDAGQFPNQDGRQEFVRVPSARHVSTRGSAVEVDPERQGQVAREASAALVTDEQDARPVDREAAADEQDVAGAVPDAQAAEHVAGLRSRRASALDRSDSRTDRACAALDRAVLRDCLSPRASSAGGEADMSEVAAELSHDLRVPLSSIIASLEMVRDQLPVHSDRTVAELVARALRASDRMVRMLEHFMTHHGQGDQTSTPEIDLAEIVRQLVLDSSDLLDPVGAVVETGRLPLMRADPDEVYSVLQNLVSNSVKFARPGVPPIVRISARRVPGGWRISVRDNGVGLPDDSGIDVFSLFSRGTRSVAGHGIGLATVARIVATHGGRVGATRPATGAEIWFELPDQEAGR